MKKLLFLGPSFDCIKGGAEYQYKVLEDHLKDDFDIYYLFRNPTLLSEKRYINYDYRFRKSYNEYIYTDSLVIYRLIGRLSPDIIYKQGVNYIAAIGAYYARSHKTKMVLHIASRRNVDKANYQRGIKIAVLNYLNQSVTKYAIDNANRIICQAQYQNTLLRANYGRSCDLILPNFHPSPEKPIKKKASPIKIVWVANFKRLKQPELFLDLAEKFQGNQLAEFIMIGRLGSGIWQDRLIEKTSRLNNLEYKGELSIDGVNEALNESHIFVNTSQYEGYPNTYIQAWMREVPVVTLNCDPDDVIKTEGLGFHSKTFQQMVQDVATLIENQQLREKMGERARKYAWSTFSVSNIQKFINLIEET